MICVIISTNPRFPKIQAVMVSAIDNVNNIASITTTNIERDLKSGYLFRTCCVATNLVTSLEFLSVLC